MKKEWPTDGGEIEPLGVNWNKEWKSGYIREKDYYWQSSEGRF